MQVRIPAEFWAELKERKFIEQDAPVPARRARTTRARASMTGLQSAPLFIDCQTTGNVGVWQILLQKSFWGDERKNPEPLMRFTRGDVMRDASIQNRSRTSVVALRSDAAAKKPKDQLSRDF